MMLGLASERLVGVAHVGDGCVVAGDGEEWRLLSEQDNGEFANETRFLTNPRNLPRVTVVSGSAISCVAVITDGLQDVALSRGSAPYERFWTPCTRRSTGARPIRPVLCWRACFGKWAMRGKRPTIAPSRCA